MKNSPIEIIVTLPFSNDQLDSIRAVSRRLRVEQYKVRKADEIPQEIWAKANILYTGSILPQPQQAPSIDWVQFHLTGIDAVKNDPFLEKSGLKITTMSGASAPQMAEFALTMMLALNHHLTELMATQTKGEWPDNRWDRFKPVELRGSTVGLVGYGSINRELARLLQPFGVTILAVKRDVMHPQDNDYSIPSLGDPQGELFDRLYPPQAIKSIVKECDYVVVAVPLTDTTRRLIGSQVLAAFKPGAYLVDISRGGVVDSEAIQQALKDNRLGGAALDVFSAEPLPADDPLWKAPRTIITPHIGGFSAKYDERAIELFIANLDNYLNDRPLFNQFNFHRGY